MGNINPIFGEAALQALTQNGKKLEKETKKGLDGFALMFANAIKYDDLSKAINDGAINEVFMGTRSLICKKIGDDKYKAIYCHSDGYLTYNGAMLIDYYNDEKKLDELLKLGNISCLCKKVNPDPNRPHSFDYNQRQADVVVAFGRDRGESGQKAKICTLAELKDKTKNGNMRIIHLMILRKL